MRTKEKVIELMAIAYRHSHLETKDGLDDLSFDKAEEICRELLEQDEWVKSILSKREQNEMD